MYLKSAMIAYLILTAAETEMLHCCACIWTSFEDFVFTWSAVLHCLNPFWSALPPFCSSFFPPEYCEISHSSDWAVISNGGTVCEAGFGGGGSYRLILLALFWVLKHYIPRSYLDYLLLGRTAKSQDAGVIGVHGPPWGGEPHHGRPAKPTECQQPQHRHPQQVQSSGNGGSQSWTALCSECAYLQRAKHDDWHEV